MTLKSVVKPIIDKLSAIGGVFVVAILVFAFAITGKRFDASRHRANIKKKVKLQGVVDAVPGKTPEPKQDSEQSALEVLIEDKEGETSAAETLEDKKQQPSALDVLRRKKQ